MKMGVSEVAHTLSVDRNLVKTWAFRFKEHLSSDANPQKGKTRQFTGEDLQVLAFVSWHWEDEPDFENIEAGLNCGDHRNEPFNEILTSVMPIFQEPPEDLDETWRHGSLLGGIVDDTFDKFTLANSYKLAGDVLVDAALSTAEASELIYPIIYNYRHATELYLKAVLSSTNREHGLSPLFQDLRDFLNRKHQTAIPSWFENVVVAFNDFDPDSTTFRYGDSGVFSRRTGDSGEFWVDLHHVKKLMGGLAESFRRIRHAAVAMTKRLPSETPTP